MVNETDNNIITPTEAVNSTSNTKNLTVNNHRGVLIIGDNGQTFNYKEGNDQIIIMTNNLNQDAFNQIVK